jgi:uncharacterized phage protein gp47/JayE
MAFPIPTIGDVRRMVRDHIAAYLPGADASVPNSNLRVMAEADAGLAHLVLQYLQNLSDQLLPDTATGEWLERHANIWKLEGRKAATFAGGVVFMTGTEGSVVPAGAVLSGGGGLEYEVTAETVLGVAATNVPARALTAGLGGNRPAGSVLALTEAIPGVNGRAVVDTMTGGVNEETDEELRARVLERIKAPPHGGDADDWVMWAKEVPGVTRAWSFGNEMGVGTMVVRVMADNDPDAMEGFPTPALLQAVRAHLDTVRPTTVKDFWVEAPIPEPINLTISNLVNDNQATRNAITAALRDMLARRASPGQTIYRSWVQAAVDSATGEDHHDMTFVNHVMPSAGHMAVLGTISYV